MQWLARLVRRFPRSIFIFSQYSYVIPISAMILVVMIIGLNNAQIDLPEIIASVAIILLSIVLYPYLRLAKSSVEDEDPTGVLKMLRNGSQHTLVAFESDYCSNCMTIDARMVQLEHEPPDGLRVIRLIIQRDPGRTLFEKYEGRMTPTYMLFDPQGQQLEEWVLNLPLNRIMYTINHPQVAA